MSETSGATSGDAGGKVALTAAAAFVALQALFFAAWIWSEEGKYGAVVRVAVLPVDPRDIVRGQYFALEYAFDRPDSYALRDGDGSVLPQPGGDVYALLRRSRSAGVYEPLCFAARL